MRQVVRRRRVAQLVVHHGDLVAVRAQAHHGLDEVLAYVAVQPRRAHHEAAAARRERALLAGQLRATVSRDGACRVVLDARLGLGAGEHVVGRHLHELRADRLGGAREVARRFGVHAECRVLGRLATIDVRHGGAVDDEVEAALRDESHDGVGVGHVELVHVGRHDLRTRVGVRDRPDLRAALAQDALQLVAQLAVAAGDEDPHAHIASLCGTILPSATFLRCWP